MIIEFDKNLTRSNWDKVFEFADKLANVYRPDIGTVYFSPAFDLYGTDQKNIDLRLILTSAFLYPAEYYQIGPKGLGNRTYIGDYYRRVFSEHCFDLLPGNVKRLDWGGLRVDLLPEVVPQNEDELISAWKANMNVLWSDQVFANCDVTNRGEFNFKRGANCSIR